MSKRNGIWRRFRRFLLKKKKEGARTVNSFKAFFLRKQKSVPKHIKPFVTEIAKEKKLRQKQIKPYIVLALKMIKRTIKILKPKFKKCVAYITYTKKQMGKSFRVFRSSLFHLIGTVSPAAGNYLIRKRNSYRRVKRRIKAILSAKAVDKTTWVGKLYNAYSEFRIYKLYLNPFGKNQLVKHTPTFLQMEATECGSICFSIILGYYQHELSAEEARTACGVSRDGSKASHIVQAARLYNMTAKGYSVKNLADLDKCTLPAIIHWNFDHFVVLEGRIGNYFFINDPATGRRRVDFQEFNQNFTGIILILTPDKGFVKKKEDNALVRFLKLSMQRGVSGILAAFFLSILQILPTLLIAMSSKVFIDYILVKNLGYWLVPLTLLLAGAVILQSVLLALHQRLLVRLSVHFKLSLESLIVHKLFYLPLRFFDQRFSGDILYRLSSAEELSNLLSLEIMGALSNVFGIFIFTLILTQLSFPMFLIMLIFIALRVIVFYLCRTSIRETNIHYQQQFGKVAGIAMNGLDMMDTLKANNLEHVFFKNWAANHDTLLNKHQRVALVDQRTMIWLLTLAALMTVGLLYRGTYLVMGEQITIGTLMAFMLLSSYLDTPLMTLLDFSSKIEKIKASINRFNDILRHDTLEEKKNAGSKAKTSDIVLPALTDAITLKDVTFGYAPLDPPIFNKLSLSIPKGKTVAFVGVSGSGKSTISKMICGLYPILEGEILWDSIPIQDVSEELITNRISLVDQDIYLFDGTVRDNLTSWNKDVDDDTLLEALRLSGLYNELLPRGLLNSPVGENGANLSGGQRQRLEIARALIRKTDVLILDEATSSLDVPNETHVYESLNKLNMTMIIIAHRLSTIQKADMIYVINDGKIVQSGTHAALSSKSGIYKQLMKLETA